MSAPPPLIHGLPAEEDPALELPGGLSRRAVFKAAGVGGVLLLGGAWVYRSLWVVGPPAPGLASLTRHEFKIAEAVGHAFFPGPPASPLSASEVGLPQFVDSYIAELYEDNRRLFKLLFHSLNLSTVLSYGRTFLHLPVPRRQDVLQSWKDSRLLARRAGIQSLRFVYSMGYFEDLRVRQALGIRFGCERGNG